MTGATHRLGGVTACLGGFLILESQGMLLTDVNPILQFAVMYPFAIYGSTVSDMDHHWKSAPSKDPISWVFWKLLHLVPNSDNSFLNAKHRSWQTHSDLFLFVMIFLGVFIFSRMPDTADQVLLLLIFTGLILGIISHMLLDMLTPSGIWALSLLGIKKITKWNVPVKISFVPNTSFFATGGKWEQLVQNILRICSVILLAMIAYKLFYNF